MNCTSWNMEESAHRIPSHHLFVLNICDVHAIDHSGVRHRSISGMSHKVTVWQAPQLPNLVHAAIYKTVLETLQTLQSSWKE